MGERYTRDEKYLLSDDSDARELLDEIDALLKSGDVESARLFHRKHLLSRDEADQEVLLHTANERWRMSARAPLDMSVPDLREGIMFALRNEVAYPGLVQGMTLGAADVLVAAAAWGVLGKPPDVRDAGTIAQQFLARVDQLTELPGGEDMDRVLARARDEVLDGVPKGYRRKVVECMLTLEEEQLSAQYGEAREVAELERTRDERRQHATRVLVQKKPGGNARGR
ncbi:MAG TPA: hypothetical protein VHB79_24115 [Polyangiaceae bacterium]|nr:hypothetical protein [Polyangiaceae bacterium]